MTKSRILYSALIAIIFVATIIGWYIASIEYQKFVSEKSRDAMNISTLESLLKNKDSKIKEQKSLLESRERYRRILSSPGTIHFLDIASENSWTLQTNPYDIIRFVNTLTGSTVSFTLYDTPDMTWSGLLSLSIAPDDIEFFPLKQSGIYVYQTSLGNSGTIRIGEASFDEYTLANFLEKKIFPLIEKTHPESLDEALRKFKEYISQDQQISKKCHDFGHKIGRKAFEYYGFSQSITHAGEDVCAWGYTHGILEAYFTADGTLADHPNMACESVEPKKRQSCYHGVGHGLMFHYSDDVTLSLEKCRTLPDDTSKNRCAEWVFMELYDADPRHAGGEVKYSTGDLFAPCQNLARPSEWYVCGFYAGLGYLRYAQEDYIGALSVCRDAGPYTNMCITGVGREIAKRYLWDALKLETICYSLSDEKQISACISGGINYTALQYENTPNIIEQYCIWLRNSFGKCESYIHSGALMSSGEIKLPE